MALADHFPDFWFPDENKKNEESPQHVQNTDNAQKNLEKYKFNFFIYFLIVQQFRFLLVFSN